MRLLLDAHISAKAVARPLRRRNHDVRAVGEEAALAGWSDEDLLELANQEQRVLITFDADDFPRIARSWGAQSRSHAGCIVIVGIDHSEFGLIVKIVERAFTQFPDQANWIDRFLFLSRE